MNKKPFIMLLMLHLPTLSASSTQPNTSTNYNYLGAALTAGAAGAALWYFGPAKTWSAASQLVASGYSQLTSKITFSPKVHAAGYCSALFVGAYSGYQLCNLINKNKTSNSSNEVEKTNITTFLEKTKPVAKTPLANNAEISLVTYEQLAQTADAFVHADKTTNAANSAKQNLSQIISHHSKANLIS